MNLDGGAGDPGTVTTNGPSDRSTDDKDKRRGAWRLGSPPLRGERLASGPPLGTEPQATGLAGRGPPPQWWKPRSETCRRGACNNCQLTATVEEVAKLEAEGLAIERGISVDFTFLLIASTHTGPVTFELRGSQALAQ